MARIPGIALWGVLLLATACGAESADDGAVSLATASATASATAPVTPSEATATAEATPADVAPDTTRTATPTTTLSAAPNAPTELTATLALDARFPAATSLVETFSDELPARIGVAVLTPDAARHAGGDDGTFALASVVKLPVMIATLERARLEQRELTTSESALLDLMITVSSNNATDELWASLGEGPGVARLLEPLGITSIEFADDDEWGDSRASAVTVALLLDALVSDESALTAEMQARALELMQGVVADQRWGASAGVDLVDGADATLAIKNGWYPDSGGWLINSAGVITVFDGDPDAGAAHVVVILTEGAETHTEGVAAIEEIATVINHELVPPSLAVAPDSPTFAETPTPDDESVASADPAAEGTTTPEADSTPAPAAVALVAHGQSRDVLVPSVSAFIGSEGTGNNLTLWYELPAATAAELLESYADSMTALGWLEVAGPPSVVLAKSGEERWVGLSAYPAAGGTQLVEVTIAPAPSVVTAAVGSR